MPLEVGKFFIGLAFRNTNDAGWVSVYYPATDTYDKMLDALDDINTAEMQILHSSVSCSRLTVSDMAVPGDLQPRSPQTTHGQNQDVEGPTDPAIALPILQVAGKDARSTRFLRGITVRYFKADDPAHFTIPQADAAPFLAYAAALTKGWQLFSRPGVRNKGVATLRPITGAFLKVAGPAYKASVRKAGRPFALRRGRRMTG